MAFYTPKLSSFKINPTLVFLPGFVTLECVDHIPEDNTPSGAEHPKTGGPGLNVFISLVYESVQN